MKKYICVSTIKSTALDQLYYYAEKAKESGEYYGNRKQFEKRHDEIVAWLNEVTWTVLNHP